VKPPEPLTSSKRFGISFVEQVCKLAFHAFPHHYPNTFSFFFALLVSSDIT
jgi:hypothetical protein